MTRNPALIIGDWNLFPAELRELVVKPLEGELVLGRGVDHAVLVGDVQLVRVRRDLPRYRSDHAPLLVDLLVDGFPVRVLWWNVYVGVLPARVLRAVRELAVEHEPDVIALGEVKRCREVLARVPGYRHTQGHIGEARSMAVLVRNRVRVTGRGWVRMRESWIGPKHGLHHGPRLYPRLRIAERETRPAQLRILAVHLPTGGTSGRNRAAVLESVERIVRWGARSAP